MKTAAEFEQAPENQPRGVAAAIIFDWSLALYFGVLLLVAIVQRGLNSQQAASAALLTIVLGLPIALLGEAIRRGKRWSRPTQIIISILLGAINVVGLIRDLALLLQGIRPVIFNSVALIAGITIIWGFTRPQTIAWFSRITSKQARERNSGTRLLLAFAASLTLGIIWAASGLQ